MDKNSGQQDNVPIVQFKFVTDSTQERSLIRRHAMQGVWRQRRQQSQQNAANRPAVDKARKLTPKQKKEENEKLREKGSSSQRGSFSRRSNHLDKQTTSDNEIEEVNRARPIDIINTGMSLDLVAASPSSSVFSGSDYVSSPSTLGGTELDPFGSLPIRIEQEEQELLHLWLGTRSLPKAKGPAKSNALEASSHSERQSRFLIRALSDCSDAASFHGIIAFAASHLASMRGQKVSALAVKHQGQAVKFITAWLKDPLQAISDNAISAVLRQLNIEMWWGTEEAATMHRNALERMIELRGGLAAFDDNPALVSSIYRVLLTSRPSWFTAARLPYSTTLNSSHLVPKIGPTHLSMHKLQLQCSRLVGLFYNLKEVSLTYGPISTVLTNLNYKYVHQAIHLLLTYSRFSDPDSKPTATHGVLEESCRLVCLFYISSIIGDLISSRPQITTLEDLNTLLCETEDFWNKSIELLYLVMVQSQNQELRDLERVQFVLGLMELGNRMTWDLWKKLRGALMEVICGAEVTDGVYFDSERLVGEVWFATGAVQK